VIQNSILDDYVYAYVRVDNRRRRQQQEEPSVRYNLAAVVFGNTFFFNHASKANIVWTSFGREPIANTDPSSTTVEISQAVGWVALRDIEPNEELFSHYDESWFQKRQIAMKQPDRWESLDAEAASRYSSDYCSLIYGGIGQAGWSRVLASLAADGRELPYSLNKRLPKDDYPVAVVRQDVEAGTLLEMAPALILSATKIRNTVLAPLGIYWQDMTIEQQQVLHDLRKSGGLVVQYQGDDTEWIRQDRFQDFSDLVLLPVGGMIGLVKRRLLLPNDEDDDRPNCRLEISPLTGRPVDGSTGIMLKLIATRDLNKGQQLLVDLPESAGSSQLELYLLIHELTTTGQPIPRHLLEREAALRGCNDEL
jgi:hypothetical protein